MLEYSNASSIGNNPAGWNMISDPFEDRFPNKVPEFLGNPGPNPAVFPHEDLSFTRSVDMFLSEETFNFFVRCTNSRADIPDNKSSQSVLDLVSKFLFSVLLTGICTDLKFIWDKDNKNLLFRMPMPKICHYQKE
ncbi:unnamed protein product [Psylliodes chrysocephalus]|uniref:Uncharacterized protein n=1 Tax=Psylliodes chrysocephalus TaxID=3402493 RepID=A0A9P0D4S2_9CUCU|nr:unnamed protein product [Psylliodes chrysocephala]